MERRQYLFESFAKRTQATWYAQIHLRLQYHQTHQHQSHQHQSHHRHENHQAWKRRHPKQRRENKRDESPHSSPIAPLLSTNLTITNQLF